MSDEDKGFKVSENTNITIPLSNLLMIIFGAAVVVTGYFQLTERISENERKTITPQAFVELLERVTAIERDILSDQAYITENTIFRNSHTPSEDDGKQNIQLEFLSEEVNEIEEQIENILDKIETHKGSTH
jgi:hypothetical protein